MATVAVAGSPERSAWANPWTLSSAARLIAIQSSLLWAAARRRESEGATTALHPAEAHQADGRSCAPVHSRSRDDAARPSERLQGQPSECGWRPHRSDDSRDRADGARGRDASCSDRQMQPFALSRIVSVSRLRREHQPQRVDHVGSRLLARVPLTEYAGHLGDRRDDPTVLSGLVDDGQIQLVSHPSDDTGAAGQSPLRARGLRPLPRSLDARVITTRNGLGDGATQPQGPLTSVPGPSSASRRWSRRRSGSSWTSARARR